MVEAEMELLMVTKQLLELIIQEEAEVEALTKLPLILVKMEALVWLL